MEFTIVDEKNIELFKKLDLFNLIPRASIGESLVMGIVDNGEDDSLIPVGLVLCKHLANSLVIEWLWIQPEYRDLGLGGEVLHKLAEFAKEKNLLKIGAYFVESANRVLFCNAARQYFKNQGFFTEVKLKGEWQAQLRQIMTSDYFKEAASSVKIVSMKSQSRAMRKKCVSSLQNVKKAMKAIQLNIDDETIDYDLFMVACDDNNNTIGAVCFNVAGDMLFLTYLWAINKDVERNLLAQVFSKANEKYGPDAIVQVILYVGEYSELFRELMKDCHLNSSLLAASPDEILDLENADLSDMDFWQEIDVIPEEYVNTVDEYFKPAETIEIDYNSLRNLVEKNKLHNTVQVESMSGLTLKQFDDILLRCKSGKHTGVFARIPASFSVEWVDLENSFVALSNDEIKGVMLIGKNDNVLIPLILYAWSEDNGASLLSLISAAVNGVLNQYTDDVKIELRCHDTFVKNLYNKLFS